MEIIMALLMAIVAADRPQPAMAKPAVSTRKFVERIVASAATQLAVDDVDGDYMRLAIHRGPDVVQVFEFVIHGPCWKPVIQPGMAGQVWGFVGMRPVVDVDDADPILLPLDETTPAIPHDNVTVLIVADDLVIVTLWNRGHVVGDFYAVDTGDDVGGVAIGPGGNGLPNPNDPTVIKVCNGLLDVCLKQLDTNWVTACGIWLQQCAAH